MKIVISGNYGAKNLGDEMILEGLLETLGQMLPDAEITVLSSNPTDTRQRHQIRALKPLPGGVRSILTSFNNWETREAVKNCDLFILGGGGLFGELSLKGNLIWAMQALQAYRYNKSVVMYGQSIGPIRSRVIRGLLKKIFQKAVLITVRDETSRDRLKNLGIHKKIYVLPDLAFRKHRGLSNLERQKAVVVALRHLKNLPKNFVEKVTAFLKWLIETEQYSIHFLDFFPQDRILHEKIAKLLPPSKIKHSAPFNTETTLAAFEQADFALCMRLHSIISALKTATPFLAINYSAKIKDFLQPTVFKNYLVPLDLPDLKSRFLEVRGKNRALREFGEFVKKQHLAMETIIGKELKALLR